ncbi:MAG: hypothetical protein HYY25_01155 [Candidatus Wallbacteria bacterium]|nr:hypothetical protein [Candidatus Wallbacteria bacterium]
MLQTALSDVANAAFLDLDPGRRTRFAYFSSTLRIPDTGRFFKTDDQDLEPELKDEKGTWQGIDAARSGGARDAPVRLHHQSRMSSM